MTARILGDKPYKASASSKTFQDKNKQFVFCLLHYLSFPFTGKFSFPRLTFTQSKQGKKILLSHCMWEAKELQGFDF